MCSVCVCVCPPVLDVHAFQISVCYFQCRSQRDTASVLILFFVIDSESHVMKKNNFDFVFLSTLVSFPSQAAAHYPKPSQFHQSKDQLGAVVSKHDSNKSK